MSAKKKQVSRFRNGGQNLHYVNTCEESLMERLNNIHRSVDDIKVLTPSSETVSKYWETKRQKELSGWLR